MGGEAVMVRAFLFLHILGGLLAIAAGHAALFARKGGPVHRRAGMLFVYSMLAMGVGAAVVGLALVPQLPLGLLDAESGNGNQRRDRWEDSAMAEQDDPMDRREARR